MRSENGAPDDAAIRLFALILQVMAVVVALGTIAVGAALSGAYATGPISRTVDVLAGTDHVPALGGSAAPVFFTAVGVVFENPSAGVRALAWGSRALWAVLILIGCAVVFLLIRRMLRDRFFSSLATAGLLILGGVAVIVAIASPWLDAQAILLGAQELGLRITSTAGGSFEASSDLALDRLAPDALDGASVIRNTNWPVLGLGVILIVVGVVFHRGHRLQRETDGLV